MSPSNAAGIILFSILGLAILAILSMAIGWLSIIVFAAFFWLVYLVGVVINDSWNPNKWHRHD